MILTACLLISLALFLHYALSRSRRHGPLAQAIRFSQALKSVTEAYRAADYKTALARTDGLKQGSVKTAPYCFFQGSMLHHLGRLEEAEASLREGLRLENEPRQRALVYNVIANVLMEQGRYPEAIAFFENAGSAWPGRGANHRGIAEVWLRQGRELPTALEHARTAVEIDRRATDMKKEALDSRLGEDLAVLAWAMAANSGDAGQVEAALAEGLPLCDQKTRPVLAQVHYHAGKAFQALKLAEKSRKHFLQAGEADAEGIFGRLAREEASR